MSGGWSVRLGVSSDAPGVAAVAHATWRVTYAALIPDAFIERFLAAAYAEERVVRRIEGSDRFDVAIDGDGAVIGFAEWHRRDDEAELVATYILPEWQGRGIGTAFHDRALDAYGEVVARLVVKVLATNTGARRFYERLGYRDPEPERWDSGMGELEDLRYVLPLAGG